MHPDLAEADLRLHEQRMDVLALGRHRSEVIDLMRPRLRRTGEPLAAILLAFLSDRDSLPDLRHRF